MAVAETIIAIVYGRVLSLADQMEPESCLVQGIATSCVSVEHHNALGKHVARLGGEIEHCAPWVV